MNPNRAPITTHVLDLSTGKPAEGIEITLETQKNGQWKSVKSGKTNSDGRVEDLLPKGTQAELGIYKMTFQTGKYFGGETFYPYAEIVFEIKNNAQHYHVPLLVSPYGFSTYRGS